MTELELIEKLAAIEMHAKQVGALVVTMSAATLPNRPIAIDRANAAIARMQMLASELDVEFLSDPL